MTSEVASDTFVFSDKEISWERKHTLGLQLTSCVTLDPLCNFSGLHFPSWSIKWGN